MSQAVLFWRLPIEICSLPAPNSSVLNVLCVETHYSCTYMQALMKSVELLCAHFLDSSLQRGNKQSSHKER
jgi:hypothetical protein